MKKLVSMLWVRSLAVLLMIAGCVAVVAATFPSEEQTSFSTDRFSEAYASYAAETIRSLDDLIGVYELDQLTYLPIAPPAPDYLFDVGWGRSLLMEPKHLPKTFIEGLLPVTRTVRGRAYTAYPVLVTEDPATFERVIHAADGEKCITLARIPAPKDYDVFWYAHAVFGEFTDLSDPAYDYFKSIFAPSRLQGRYDLVTKDAVTTIAASQAIIEEASPLGGGMVMMSMLSSPPVTNLCFVGLERHDTNTLAMDLTLAVPDDYTDTVSLVACTNLLTNDWVLLTTTNAPQGTNTLLYVDWDAGSCSQRFYHAYNATVSAATDPDDDGLTTGYEQFILHTSPTNPHDPPNIKGTIAYSTYSGGQTGPIYVVAVTSSNSWSTNYCTVLSDTGAYHIVNVPADSYWIKAWRDSDLNGAVGTYEAQGMWSNVSLSVTGQITGVDIVLADPDTDLDGMVDWWETAHGLDPASATGDDGAAGDPDNDDMANLWEYTYGFAPDSAADATTDADNDGYLNVYECIHGTDPTSSVAIPTPTLIVTNQGAQTLQQAIDQATNNYDIIMVKSGTYSAAGDHNLDFKGKPIMLTSENGPSATIIDCQNNSRGFSFQDNETRASVVNGFTITHGSNALYGGAILCSNAAPTIRGCIMTANFAPKGAGLYGIDNANFRLDASTLSDNSGTTGIGLACKGSAPLITDCDIDDNQPASGAGDGGGIWLDNSPALIDGCAVRGNISANGGGIYVKGVAAPTVLNSDISENAAPYGGGVSVSGSLLASNCTFRANAGSFGGGVCVLGTFSAKACQFSDNGALYGGGLYAGGVSASMQLTLCNVISNTATYDGGGINSYSATFTLDSCRIIDNTASSLGGGIAMSASAQYTFPEIRNTYIHRNTAHGIRGGGLYGTGSKLWPHLQSVTVTENSATVEGSGYCLISAAGTTVRDSIFWGNAEGQVHLGALSPTVDYCCIQGGGISGTGNITNPPCLIDSYQLFFNTSSCIDAAAPSGGLDDDIDGRSRPVGSGSDIGCHEFEYVDEDSDQMHDGWEIHFFNNTAHTGTEDPDGDGLDNRSEYEAETDPLYWDSDGDGMSDAWEWEYGMNPAVSNNPSIDTDEDGWTDQEEADQGTDPTDNDTDGDGVDDGDDADPLDTNNSAVTNGLNTAYMTLTVGDRSGSHSERYKIVVGPYQVYMSHVSSSEYEFSKTFRVPRGKEYEGYLESLPDDDDDGDYDADVTGGGIMVDDPWPSDSSGRVLGGHHENSGFNSGQRAFTVTIAGSMSDEESTDHVDADAAYANSVDPINTINGNVTVSDTDIVLPAPGIPLVLRRAYDSRSVYTNSPVGACWSHSYDWHLADVTNHVYRGVSNDWKVLRTGSGDLHWFEAQTNGTFKSPAGVDYRLTDETTHYDLLVGGQITFEFSTNGLLDSIADPYGNALTFTYTTSGGKQVVSDIDHSSGPSLAFTYSSGLLTRVDTPTNTLYVTYNYSGGELTGATRYASGESYVTSYGYGDAHSLTQRVNAAGDRFDYAYEIVTNANDVVIAKGTSMSLNDDGWYAHSVAYSTASNRSTLTYERDATNQVFDYRYDPDTLAISAIYGPNSTNLVTRYTRDAAHNVTRIKVADEATGEYLLSSMSHDARHNLASSAVGYNALPLHTWNYVWDLTNNTLLSATDPLGNESTFEYSGTLPVAAHRYPAQGVTLTTTYGYTTNGQLAAVTNANGHWGRFEYGAHGFVTSSVPQAGPTVGYAYNALGHLTSITMPGASGDRTTAFVPDDMGRVTSVSYPLGSLSESFAYDKMGNLTNHTDTAGRDTRFTYLPTRKLTSVTRGSGAEEATLAFDYDQQFNTLTIKDALDRAVEAYVLDIQDRPVTITNVESQTMSVVYGVGDMVKSVTRFDGTTVSNSYDSSARLTGVAWPDLASSFSYYDNALLRSVANEAGIISNTFDNANRLTSVSLALHSLGDGGSVVDYSLDGIGNATSVLVTVDGSVILTNTYAFDAAERVCEIDGAGGAFEFSYSQYNGLVAGVSNRTSGIHAEYAFDALDRLTNVVWRNATDGVLRSFGYRYNSAGMLTNVARETAAESVAYGYDALDRLTSAGSSYLTATYGWDLVGNPTSRVENAASTAYTLGTGNRLASWTGGSYACNAAGCVTDITRGIDTLSLGWNSRYEMTAVDTNAVPAATYGYDPLGRRAWTAHGGVTNWHVYDGAQVVADTDADGNLLRTYTWGPGVDCLLCVTVYGTEATNTYYALTDHLGTVHALVDGTGTIVESYRYDAWGRVLGVYDGSGAPITGSAVGNRYLWQGREYSWATGLYYFRARWYDPVTGRWLSKDPIGISGGLNQYVFCGNNPVNFRDPDGLFAKEGHEYWMDVAVAGQDRGGIGGNLQTAGASLMTAFIDFWGARSIQNNAEKSGYYSGEGCTGKAVGHGLLAGGQIALAATAAFGGNNAAHPWYRYLGPRSLPTYASGRVASGAWVVRGRAFSGAPFGRNFGAAKNALQMPYTPDDVIRVQGAWKQFIRSRGRATGYPNLGTGGAHQWQVF